MVALYDDDDDDNDGDDDYYDNDNDDDDDDYEDDVDDVYMYMSMSNGLRHSHPWASSCAARPMPEPLQIHKALKIHSKLPPESTSDQNPYCSTDALQSYDVA